MNTSVTLTGLSNNTTYYWQVRARNAGGTTYANGSFSAFGSFTIFIPPPTAFTKYFPAADAANIPINPVLDWQDSPGATVYSYCIDPVSNNTCDTTWKTTGTTSQVQLSDLGFGFTYEWQVAASGPGGVTFANGGETSFWDFITVGPGPFNKNNPASPVPTNPILTWGTSNGATGYEYCIDTTNDHACANWISIGANTSVYLAGLTINTEYYWQVRAINADGITYATGYYENFYSFVPSSRSFGKLSPANGAVGIPIDPTITWQILAGATSYEYCNDTTNDFNCSNWVNVGQNTSSTITGLDYLTTYYWQVRTIGAIPLLADNTIFWSFTTVNEPPASFNKVSPDNGASGMATHLSLNWESSSRVSSYAYCIDTSNDNACSNWISVGNTTSVDIGGLLNNTLYYWQVRATNDGGTTYANESPTAFWSFATIEAPPGAFTKVAPENLATGVVTHPELTWGTSSGVSYYEYCYDMSTDLSCANWIGTGRDIYGDLAGLSYNHTYHWQVRAVNTGGITYANTDETAYWYFTVVAPPAFSKTAPISGAVGVTDNPILDWEDSPGAINYEYCMDTSEDNTCSDWIGTGSSSHAELFGLNNFATYYWQVRVVNADGIEYANASEAAYWSFTTVNKLYLPITMR